MYGKLKKRYMYIVATIGMHFLLKAMQCRIKSCRGPGRDRQYTIAGWLTGWLYGRSMYLQYLPYLLARFAEPRRV